MPKVLKIKTDNRVRTRILPDRKVKKTRKFDIVGELLTHYGEITGENVTRQIFSYLGRFFIISTRTFSVQNLESFLDDRSTSVTLHGDEDRTIP